MHFVDFNMKKDKLKIICRCCLSINLNKFEIFFDNALPIIYQSLTNLQVTSSDGLPHVICSQCKENLQNFQLFKDQCIQSYNEFKNQEIVKTEFEQNNFDFKTECVQDADIDEGNFEHTECLTYTEP